MMMFGDVLHGFRNSRGTKMAIMDIKIEQDLTSVDQVRPRTTLADPGGV